MNGIRLEIMEDIAVLSGSLLPYLIDHPRGGKPRTIIIVVIIKIILKY